jgi:hypothetical protein
VIANASAATQAGNRLTLGESWAATHLKWRSSLLAPGDMKFGSRTIIEAE